MMLKAMKNTIYYAGTNYASTLSDAASSITSPNGTCLAHVSYDRVGVSYQT